ncbi:MAG: glycosyltransferase family 4 protein [Candidatus Omnitrophota bacterium]
MKRLKIALVSHTFQKDTGAGRYMVELAKALSREHRVHIIANSWDKGLEGSVSTVKLPMIKGPSFFASLIFSFLSLLRLSRQKFNVIQEEITTFSRHSILTAHECLKSQLRIMLPEVKKEPFRRLGRFLKPRFFYILLMEKYHYRLRNYKRIIAVSPLVKIHLIQEYRVPEEDIVIIPNGVSLSEFALENETRERIRKELRRRYRIKDDDSVILFVGHDFKRKGLDYVIKALKFLPEKTKLLVAGKGYNPFGIPFYRKLAQRLGLVERVVFAGAVSEITNYYHAGDIFTLLSLDEPCSLAVLEAMASRIPVIVSKAVGAPYLLKDREECMVIKDPSDINEIADAIRSLSDLNLRNKIIEGEWQKAKILSWERVAENVTAVYYATLE